MKHVVSMTGPSSSIHLAPSYTAQGIVACSGRHSGHSLFRKTFLSHGVEGLAVRRMRSLRPYSGGVETHGNSVLTRFSVWNCASSIPSHETGFPVYSSTCLSLAM